MNDYISREAAKSKKVYSNERHEYVVPVADLDWLSTADVKPVVRGKWETVMLDHKRMGCRPTAHYCSECHQITWFRTFFCPNCGADMREGE